MRFGADGSALDETRERFLRAITTRVPAERIAEIHFFPPIKQAGVESGVAVVVEQASAAPADSTLDASADSVLDTAEQPALADVAPPGDSAPRSTLHAPRIVVYTARYRLVLKGADRGKWEASVVAEADAPIGTVDAVVRGVQRRAGDIDDAIRMDGSEARAIAEDSAGR